MDKSEKAESLLSSAAVEAARVLTDFYRNPEKVDKDFSLAKIANATVGAWTRQQQTKSAVATTTFMIGRELAGDKEQLRQYINASMPDLGITKMLPEKAS